MSSSLRRIRVADDAVSDPNEADLDEFVRLPRFRKDAARPERSHRIVLWFERRRR
jgi:hypothetical protein